MTLPDFTEGIHYRQLKGGNYRFELTKNITLSLPYMTNTKRLSLRDCERKEWVRIIGNRYTISAGYRWNGSSPKWWVPLIGWVGTPDPVATRLASCFHDTAFQFLRVADYPLGYDEANEIFHDIMLAAGFRFAGMYHGAVKDLGQYFFSDYPERGEHSVIL